jgi:hypothetical protein
MYPHPEATRALVEARIDELLRSARRSQQPIDPVARGKHRPAGIRLHLGGSLRVRRSTPTNSPPCA